MTKKGIILTILILLPIIICGIMDANDYKKCNGDYQCLKAHNLH